MANPNEWLNTSQVAALLGKTDRSVRLYAKSGKLAGQRFGPMWMFKRADVERFSPNPPGYPSHKSK